MKQLASAAICIRLRTTNSAPSNATSPCRLKHLIRAATERRRAAAAAERTRRDGASRAEYTRVRTSEGEIDMPNACRLKSREICRQTASPRALLPFASSGGEKTAMPKRPGITAITPPLTPLFAGRPTSNSQLPA